MSSATHDEPGLKPGTLEPTVRSGADTQGSMTSDGLDIESLIAFVLQHWLQIAVLAFCGAAIGYGTSYLRPKMYRAEALVSPISENGSQSPLKALAGRFGALANLAGMDAEGGGFSTPAVVAMLKSREFLEGFIGANELLPVLFYKKWDQGKWKLKKGQKPPTLEDGYDLFSKKLLSVAEDRKTGLITIRIDWIDREQGAAWVNALIARINAKTRELTIADATRSLDYLSSELEHSQTVDLRRSIFSLVESQMNRRMVASTRPDFAFRVLDRAQPTNPRKYVSPRRIRYLAFGLLVGTLAGFAIAARRQVRSKRQRSVQIAAG